MRTLALLLLVPLALAIGVSAAIDEPETPSTRPDDEQPAEQIDWLSHIGDGDTTFDMIQRSGQAKAALDQRMQDTLAQMHDRLDEEGDAVLDQSQQAWLVYAQAESNREGDFYRGGSLSPIARNRAYVAEMARRIKELRATIEQWERLGG